MAHGIRSMAAVVLGCALVLAVPTPASAAPTVGCGDVITNNVTLTADLTCTGTALVVDADWVTIDLNRHTISGSGSGGGDGIAVSGHTGLTVRDGTIRGFRRGITVDGAGTILVSGVALLHNGTAGDLYSCGFCADASRGVRVRNTSIAAPPGGYAVRMSASRNVVVERSEFAGQIDLANVADGYLSQSRFHIGPVVLSEVADFGVWHNTFNGAAVDLTECVDITIAENDLAGSPVTVNIVTRVLIRDNRIRGPRLGVSIAYGPTVDVRVVHNQFFGSRYGVHVRVTFLAEVSGLAIAGNTFTGHRAAGVFLEATGTLPVPRQLSVSGNVFRLNGYDSADVDAAGRRIDDGLHTNVPVSSPLLVARNRTYANADFGIEALPVGSVRDGGGNRSTGDARGCAGVVCALTAG